MARSGLMTTHRHRCRPKEANSISLFPANLTTQDAYFESTVGILLNWIKGWNFSQCRQDCPLPPPINRGGFQGLKEKKITSKVGQKTSHFPQFCNFSLFPLPPSLSIVAFGHHHSYHHRFIIVSTTSSHLNSSPTVYQVATVALSLSPLYKPFSSSSISWTQPSFPQPTPPEPPVESPHHARDPYARQLSPLCFASLFLFVVAACKIHFCIQWLIN